MTATFKRITVLSAVLIGLMSVSVGCDDDWALPGWNDSVAVR